MLPGRMRESAKDLSPKLQMWFVQLTAIGNFGGLVFVSMRLNILETYVYGFLIVNRLVCPTNRLRLRTKKAQDAFSRALEVNEL